jgi:catechol 2,3-dioxygenase-like lactoylglutathione lyase family enzyme
MPLTGFIGVDHLAFVVPELEEAVDLFCTVLGADKVMESTLTHPGGSWMSEQLDVDASAAATLAHLRLGPITNIELWEYSAPTQRVAAPDIADRGGHYLSILVDDISLAHKYMLGARGFSTDERVQSEKSRARSVVSRFMCRTEWGLAIEVVDGSRATLDVSPSRDAASNQSLPSYRSEGIPTAKYVHHMGVSVPDISAARSFFVDALGATLVSGELGCSPFATDATGRPRKFSRELLRLGPTCYVELSEWEGSSEEDTHPMNSDVGGHHIALSVVDIDVAADELRQWDGVRCLGESQHVTDGPVAGDWWQYVQLPWGLYIELINMPVGIPFGRQHSVERFEPKAWVRG